MMEEKEIGSEQHEEKHSTTSRGPRFNPWLGGANTQYCTLYVKNEIKKILKKKKKSKKKKKF